MEAEKGINKAATWEKKQPRDSKEKKEIKAEKEEKEREEDKDNAERLFTII